MKSKKSINVHHDPVFSLNFYLMHLWELSGSWRTPFQIERRKIVERSAIPLLCYDEFLALTGNPNPNTNSNI